MSARRTLRTVATTATGGWLLLCALLFFGQDLLVYHPRSHVARTPDAAGLAYVDVVLETDDGERLGAWYVKTPRPRGTVLFCHGNGGNIGHRVSTLEVLTGLGLDVLIFDYRGFGTSTGTPSEAGLYADARAAWVHLTQVLGVDPDTIVIMGRSLGGGVATQLAAEVEAAALVVESSFTSAVALGQQTYWFVPVSFLARNRFESIDRIADVGEPVLVAHSEADEMIPYGHGRALFDAARAPKHFLELRGGHNDAHVTTGAAYRDGLAAFLDPILPPRSAPPNVADRDVGPP